MVFIVMALVGFAAAQEAEQFTCPMHPHYIADEMGTCPICGMDLVPVARSQVPASGQRDILYYKHPMGLPDTSPVPKKDSMGMDYIPVYADADRGPIVTVAPEMIQNMGVRTAPASEVVFGRQIRAFGTVAPSPRLETVVASRVEGWIENLSVTAEGDTVERGQLLYRFYSPDLQAAQQDYLAARRSSSSGRARSASQRLRSLGLQDAAIEALQSSGQVQDGIPVIAEADGTVSSLSIRDGSYLRPGDPIMRLQAYDTVWIEAEIAEQDLSAISVGTEATASFPADPAKDRKVAVDYVYPTVDGATRTGRIRFVLDNPNGALRPGAFADVRLSPNRAARLSVPRSAVLRSSEGDRVILALGEGRFAPRPVQTGLSAEGRTEVLAGLQPGDEIVVSGQFMLGSEASLREGFTKLTPPEAAPLPDPGTPLSALPMTTERHSLIDHYIDAALYLHEALTDGYAIQPSFLDATLQAGTVLNRTFGATALGAILDEANTAMRTAQNAADDGDLRDALAQLSAAMEPWITDGAPDHYARKGIVLFRADDGGRLWIQDGLPAANPYGTGSASVVPLLVADMSGVAE